MSRGRRYGAAIRVSSLLVIAALGGIGCAVGPDFHRPDAPPVSAYTGASDTSAPLVAEGREQRFVTGAPVVYDWWRLFGSPKVDSLVAHAFADNPSLEAARATLARSLAQMRSGAGVFYPRLDVGAGASYQRFNPAPGIFPASNFGLLTLSGSVSYALDIWGGQRRTVEQLRALADADRYNLAGAWVMLAGNIVDAVIARAGYLAEIEATRATLAVEEQQLRITEAQHRGGTVPLSNVLSVRSLIATTRANLPGLEQKADEASHLLATLTGRLPSELTEPAVALTELSLPGDLPVVVPSEIVRQRPDILVAEAQLHAANASIGIATAAMLPSLTLSGSWGQNARGIDQFFTPNAAVWNLGAGLAAPIFHGGQLYYARQAAVHSREQTAALYRQTVLSAFAQVADALRAVEHDAEALRGRVEALVAATEQLRLVHASYQAGVTSYLDVLAADTQYLQAALALIDARAQRMQDTVRLFVALGGGWSDAPPAKLPAP